MKGTREERAVLIRDPNKIVGVAVLSSPKITETEVEAIAKNATVSDEIPADDRLFARLDEKLRHRPRTGQEPEDAGGDGDELPVAARRKGSAGLSTNRNIPEVLRVTARKKIVLERRVRATSSESTAAGR